MLTDCALLLLLLLLLLLVNNAIFIRSMANGMTASACCGCAYQGYFSSCMQVLQILLYTRPPGVSGATLHADFGGAVLFVDPWNYSRPWNHYGP